MKRQLCACLLCLVLVLVACDAAPSSSEAGIGGSTTRAAIKSTEPQFQPPTAGRLVATIETDKGNIGVVLFPEYAPQAVENFRLLAQGKDYDNTFFHRVVQGFIIQGGSLVNGDKSAWNISFPSEISDKMHHYAGALCMVNSGGEKGNNQSQFYIVATPQGSVTETMLQNMRDAGIRPAVVEAYAAAGGAPYLDNTATVFGQVYTGMDIVDRICSVATDETQQPKNPIKIKAVTIQEYALPPTSPV